MNMNQKYSDVVNQIRKVNLMQQGLAIRSGIHNHLGIAEFIKEYKTISIDCGRMVGKTDYILNNAEPTDLIIVTNSRWVDEYKKLLYPQGKDTEVWSVHSISNKLRGNRFAFRDIFIDEPAEIMRHREVFYDLLRDVYVSNQIIMLGSPY